MLIIINKRKRSSKSKWSNSNKNIIFLAQQGAVAHLRNVHHPSELLIPPVPVQNQVSQCLQAQTLWGTKSEWEDFKCFGVKRKRPITNTHLSQWEHWSSLVSPLLCGRCLSAAASPALLSMQKNDTDNHSMKSFTVHNLHTPPVINGHLHYLDMFCKKLHCFGFTLETSQLPVNDTNKHHSCHFNLKVVTGETRQTSVVCHLLDELDGSESRAADDKQNHRTFFCVLLLNLCPLGSN